MEEPLDQKHEAGNVVRLTFREHIGPSSCVLLMFLASGPPRDAADNSRPAPSRVCTPPRCFGKSLKGNMNMPKYVGE